MNEDISTDTKQFIKKWLDGEELQYWSLHHQDWIEFNPKQASLFDWENFQLRVKPSTIRIGNEDVPSPLKISPTKGTIYYVPTLDFENGLTGSIQRIWGHDARADSLAFTCGMVHLDEDSAEEHTIALIKVSGGSLL